MPNRETFSIPIIGKWVQAYLDQSQISVDPFARNNRWATHTNDLDPSTRAEHHMDAEAFLQKLKEEGISVDLVLFDPPYSPRQMADCYKNIGMKVAQRETQNAHLYKRVRDALIPILAQDATILSFGWNSAGMGTERGFRISEILLCCHGGAHNDTICMAEQWG